MGNPVRRDWDRGRNLGMGSGALKIQNIVFFLTLALQATDVLP